ncbi:zinc ribbon domain-containing protein [Alicyclobacillus mengziensis]
MVQIWELKILPQRCSKNRVLAKSIGDVGWGELVMDKMPLHVRSGTCPKCGTVHDRDMNAAMNIFRRACGVSLGRGGKTCSKATK